MSSCASVRILWIKLAYYVENFRNQLENKELKEYFSDCDTAGWSKTASNIVELSRGRKDIWMIRICLLTFVFYLRI